jgi:hypothetical protein
VTLILAIAASVSFALFAPALAHGGDGRAARAWTPRWAAHTDPNVVGDSVGTEIAYDQQVADRYDDGYGPHVHLQFEEALAPHGTWIDSAELGRVWVPSPAETGTDFWPYRTGGHWALTEYGWTWSSDWPWGWLPFHYGRWAFLPARGWCWVPGTLWSPAWVAWRQGKAYVAWAPLPPRGMRLARPIGTLSPWWMVRARTLDHDPEFVPRRQVPALFSLTAAVSNPRTLATGDGAARVNAGPLQRSYGRVLRAARLIEAAPRAAPAFVVEPRPGAAIGDRPWVKSGFLDQVPFRRWPAPGNAGEDTSGGGRPGARLAPDHLGRRAIERYESSRRTCLAAPC